MAEQTIIEVRGFKGINLREPSNMVQDDELVECINFDIGRAGELEKRTGFSLMHNGDDLGIFPTRLIGQFKTDDYNQIFVETDGDLWYSANGIDFTLLRADFDASFGIQYIDKFYFVRTDGYMLEWDGTGGELLDDETANATATVGDWVNKLNATVSRDSNAASEGTHSIKAIATAASQMQITTTEGATGDFLVTPGTILTITGKARPDTTTRTVELYATFWDSAGVQVGAALAVDSESCTNDVFTTLTGTVTVPANARYLALLWEVDSPAAGQIFNFDEHSVRDPSGKEIIDSPRGTFCTVYRDRLYVVNSEGDGTDSSKLVFSEINDFSDTGWPSDNNILVSAGDGDFLTCLAVIHDTLIVFKAETTWGLYVQGQPDNWILRNMNPEIGCISKYTPREIEGFLYFVGPRGVYKTDGNIFEDISANISSVFENRVVSISNANIDCAAWWEDKYIILFNPTPSTRRYFIYHLRSEGWTEWTFGEIEPAFFLEIQTSPPGKGLWAGDLNSTGKIFKYGDSVRTDDGVEFECSLITKHFDLGSPALMKRAKWIAPELEGVATVSFVHKVDGSDKFTRTLSATSGRKAYKVAGAEFFRSWAVDMSFTNDQAFTFFGFSLFMHTKSKIRDHV